MGMRMSAQPALTELGGKTDLSELTETSEAPRGKCRAGMGMLPCSTDHFTPTVVHACVHT